MAISSALFIFLLVTIQGALCDINQLPLNSDLFNFHDLTHPFGENTVYWPTSRKFEFIKEEANTRSDGSWYAANDFAAGEHGGTHIDAPYHFARDGKHVGEIELKDLIVPLIVTDVSKIVNGNPNFVLYKHHLDYILNDNFGKPCVIIFRFGWNKYYNDKTKYLGMNAVNKTLNFPGLSGEVAQWIAKDHKNVLGVGLDVASADPGNSEAFPAHKALLGTGRYIMENVNIDDNVPSYGCTALVLPMKIALGTGAPLRLVAVCPKVGDPNKRF